MTNNEKYPCEFQLNFGSFNNFHFGIHVDSLEVSFQVEGQGLDGHCVSQLSAIAEQQSLCMCASKKCNS